jgi:catechol-2,3-dioxygenase
MDPAVGSIMQVGVTVSDVETALAYYQGVLGLSLLFRPSPSLAFLSGGAVRIMLTSPQGAGTVGANSILYFRVEGI